MWLGVQAEAKGRVLIMPWEVAGREGAAWQNMHAKPVHAAWGRSLHSALRVPPSLPSCLPSAAGPQVGQRQWERVLEMVRHIR